LFGSRVLASSKAFKKEAIAACCTPKGNGNHENIFDVDNDETQLPPLSWTCVSPRLARSCNYFTVITM
jgi:hypothetical protein